MIDFWQRFFGNSFYNPNRGVPGGGTPPSTDGGPGTKPFGQPGPGFRDDLGHPFYDDRVGPGYFSGPAVDPFIDPTITTGMDPRMVFNPDQGLPLGFGGSPFGLGGEPRVYDVGEMQDLISSLRGSSPESLPNPAPNEAMDAYTPYGTPPNMPSYELPPMQFQDLFNPNTGATNFPFDVRDFPSGMETINWTPPPGMPPGQDLNFGASDFPNIPGGGNVSADQIAYPPSDLGYNPPPNEGMYPTYTDYPAGTEATYYPSPENVADAGGSEFQWPFYIDQFPDDTGAASANYPTPPGVTPDVLPGQNVGVPRAYYGPGANMMQSPGNIFPGQQPIATGQPGMFDPRTGQTIPGTALSPTDEASMYNRGPVIPLDQSFLDQLRAPTDWKHAGQLFRDAAGNILDAAGKVIGTIGDLARGAGNLGKDFINNIMNDPRNTDPKYLASIGYQPGQGTGSLWPGGPTTPPSEGDLARAGIERGDQFGEGSTFSQGTFGPNVFSNLGGVGGGGGTVAGGGTVGNLATAIGFGGNLGGGGPVNIAALGGGRGLPPIALGYLRRMYKGLYTPRSEYGSFKYPPPNVPTPSFDVFHSGQVQLHDILTRNPAYYQALLGNASFRSQGGGTPREPGSVGRGDLFGSAAKASRHTPTIQPK